MTEKKEIWKLLELLNEYEKDWVNEFETYVERWYCERTYQILSGKWENSNELKPCEIISKRYWFIKWLVENDKIDKRKIDTRLVRNVESHYDEDWYWVENSYEDYSDTDTLLMLLSISDTPIEDLISYLK